MGRGGLFEGRGRGRGCRSGATCMRSRHASIGGKVTNNKIWWLPSGHTNTGTGNQQVGVGNFSFLYQPII